MTRRNISRVSAAARTALFLSGAVVLAGSLALAQSPAPAPPAQDQPPAAQGRGMQDGPGMHSGGMQGSNHSDFHSGREGFSGGHGGFRGAGASMGGTFHIATAGMWWKNPGIVQKLSLTAEQTKKMDDIFQQSRLQLIDLKANVEKQNAILEPMLSANPPDTAQALAQIDKVAQARAELEKADARMLLGIRGVLTPDQWTKLHTPTQRGGPPAAAGTAP